MGEGYETGQQWLEDGVIYFQASWDYRHQRMSENFIIIREKSGDGNNSTDDEK